MNTVLCQAVGNALLFIGIFITGYRTSRSGKPYPIGVFTLHKFAALGALLFLAIPMYRFYQVNPLNLLTGALLALSAVLFVLTIVTGGLLSGLKIVPPFVQSAHHFAPYLTALACAAALYQILAAQSVRQH